MRESGRMLLALMVLGLVCATVTGCRGDDTLPPPSASGRATFPFEASLEVTGLRSRIIRSDRRVEDVGDEELFLYAGNRASITLKVRNGANGWAPINFELCADHVDLLSIIDPQQAPEAGGLLPDPCSVRYRDHEWYRLERGEEIELFVGAVEARSSRPGGGYLTVYFRTEFEPEGVYDLYEYTVPYRVVPSGSRPLLPSERRLAVLTKLDPPRQVLR